MPSFPVLQKGADTFGERWAEEQDLPVNRFPADWETHGKRAGPLRNGVMAENAEGLIAVWDGSSHGTRSMIELAAKRGLRIAVLRTDTDALEEYSPKGRLADMWEHAEERAALREFDGGLPRRVAEQEAGAEVWGRYAVDGVGAADV